MQGEQTVLEDEVQTDEAYNPFWHTEQVKHAVFELSLQVPPRYVPVTHCSTRVHNTQEGEVDDVQVPLRKYSEGQPEVQTLQTLLVGTIR